MKGKKGQESTSTNYLTTGIIVALVVVTVFISIIRAETIQKLRDLPSGEEEVEEQVEVTMACQINQGYTKQSDACDGMECLHINLGKSSYPTPIYVQGNKIYVSQFGSDTQVGVVESKAGYSILRFYCNAKDLGTEGNAFFDSFNGAYFLGGISQGGEKTLCKGNVTYDIFQCSGGLELRNRLVSKIMTMNLKSMKRGSQGIIRIKGEVNAKENAKFQFTETGYFSRDLSNRINWNFYNDFPAASTLTLTTDFRREIQFVWDECQNKAFAISYLGVYLRYLRWTSYNPVPYLSRIRFQDSTSGNVRSLLFKEIFTRLDSPGSFLGFFGDPSISAGFLMGNKEEEFLVSVLNVLKSKSQDDFISNLADFTILFCEDYKQTPSFYGWLDNWQGSISEGECDMIDGMEKEKAVAYINSTFFNPKQKYCGSYECLLDGKWQECQFFFDKFCSKQNPKNCVGYAWGDVFEFYDPVEKESRAYTLNPDFDQG